MNPTGRTIFTSTDLSQSLLNPDITRHRAESHYPNVYYHLLKSTLIWGYIRGYVQVQ
nr:MAG TPA: hypothetical protein [Caudoviricetes sp.]